MKLFWLLAVIIFLSAMGFPVIAQQKVVMLHKPGKKTRITWYESDKISLLLLDGAMVSGTISAIGDSSITIGKVESVPLTRVKSVADLNKRRHHKKLSRQCFTMAAVTLTFNSLHRIINQEQQPVDLPTAAMTGLFVTGGLVLSQFKMKQYRVTKKWKLVIMNL